jgi:phosphoribosylformimino-5-aminoimidazole carboxamide ribotide isomerase
MRIIPAIDIIGGQCVRLSKGDYSTEVVYNEHPLEVAKAFEDAGLRYLHLVDLDGAKSNRIVNHKVLYQIASKTGLHVDFGGGLKSDDDLRIAFENGARQVTAGSVAVQKPELFLHWLKTHGPEKIILGADCHDRKIAAQGWLEQSEWDVLDFIKHYEAEGVQSVICTDIALDGMLQGPSLELYKEIMEHSKVALIASGGVSSVQDLEALREAGCEGAIVGKAIYEGKISLKQLAQLC